MKNRRRKKILKPNSVASVINQVGKVGGEFLPSGQKSLVLVPVPSLTGTADLTEVDVVVSGVHAIAITAEVDNFTRK